MIPVSSLSARAALFPGDNVDTDTIVPARFLYRNRKDGFKDTLFYDLRLDKQGMERPDFVLNQAAHRDPGILVCGDNFGCGSSREHAVWALLDSGIACVIAGSFGDIFRSNAIENGLLPVSLPQEELEALRRVLEKTEACDLVVNLIDQVICGPEGYVVQFAFDAAAKEKLILGQSAIDATLAYRADIERFEKAYRLTMDWIFEPCA